MPFRERGHSVWRNDQHLERDRVGRGDDKVHATGDLHRGTLEDVPRTLNEPQPSVGFWFYPTTLHDLMGHSEFTGDYWRNVVGEITEFQICEELAFGEA